ncbi:MAG: Spy/CpxP family protein refolding chaperone [Hyphomicrobium sp.]
MNYLSRAVAVTLLAAAIPATMVVAQQAEQEPVESKKEWKGLSSETKARLEDGRIAMAKTALQLNEEQEKLWAPVEEQIRADYAECRTRREQWREKRAERRDGQGRDKLTLPERVEHRSEKMTKRATRMNERAERTKEFAEVLKPFYASLSDEQKEVADVVLRRFAGGTKGHRRYAHKRMCRGRGGWRHGSRRGSWH